MTDETLTQPELEEILGKLNGAIERGEIEEFNPENLNPTWRPCSLSEMHIGPHVPWKFRIRRKPIAGWVNVYPEGSKSLSRLRRTKEECDRTASADRIACVYVEDTEAPGDE